MQDEEIYRAIGRRLRVRRRMLGMTQEQVARGCGLTFQQIQKYEAGLVAIPAARLVNLAVALQAPIGALIDGLGAPPIAANASGTPGGPLGGPLELGA